MSEPDATAESIAYDGWCAAAMALGRRARSDARWTSVHAGRTYRFSTPHARKLFEQQPGPVIEKADRHWARLRGAWGATDP